MTAEVGVINRRGVALAADSAVTINNSKVTNSAVKLFTLDSAHYVGIMFFGNAELQNIPWEVIIKSYREKIGNVTFAELEDYVNDFQKYVAQLDIWDSEEARWAMVNKYALTILTTLRGFIGNGESLDDSISKTRSLVPAKKSIDVDKNKLVENFESKIISEFKSAFANISDSQCSECVKLVVDFLMSDYTPNDYTGIVFAGYGKNEMFPSMHSFQVDGVIDGKIKTSNHHITICNPLKSENVASITPFAQSDVMETVIYGIAPELNSFRQQQFEQLKESIIKYIPEKERQNVKATFDDYNRMFNNHSQSEYVSPIVSMIYNLSVSELGNVAQMLVNLTAFKRKISNDIGTVGGPTDVLTISRGEGPVWIKRKEYFNENINEGYKLRRK